LDEISESGFKIEIIPMAYPAYPPNIVLSSTGSRYVKFHTKITFSCGVILDSYAGDWIYQNKHYKSLEEVFDSLPEEAQQIILFNLEIFRGV
jgi:hypothetical protein